MNETVMLIALGFTAASLLALLIAPAAWRRAVRLTTRKLEATLPISLKDINADKDLLRAESAVEIRRLELALEQAKERAARHLMERNLYTVEIGKLESEIASLKDAVLERTRGGEVLEQTVQRRIPHLEARLAEAGQVIATREQELAARARAIGNQNDALDLARKMLRRQEQEIDRLRQALEGGAGEHGRLLDRLWGMLGNNDEARTPLLKKIGGLEAELSRMREERARLKEADASDAAELRAEMHRLADLMLSGTAPSKPGITEKKPQPRPAPDKPAKDKQAGTSAAKQDAPESKKKTPAKTARRAKRAASPRKSLSERLTGFRGKKEKENA
ncbi:MAG: hypothetical protein ACE5FM_02775 [Methyloligellaceae bacterium]